MSIYQQKLLLSQFMNHNFKSTIFIYKKDNFLKIDVFENLFINITQW